MKFQLSIPVPKGMDRAFSKLISEVNRTFPESLISLSGIDAPVLFECGTRKLSIPRYRMELQGFEQVPEGVYLNVSEKNIIPLSPNVTAVKKELRTRNKYIHQNSSGECSGFVPEDKALSFLLERVKRINRHALHRDHTPPISSLACKKEDFLVNVHKLISKYTMVYDVNTSELSNKVTTSFTAYSIANGRPLTHPKAIAWHEGIKGDESPPAEEIERKIRTEIQDTTLRDKVFAILDKDHILLSDTQTITSAANRAIFGQKLSINPDKLRTLEAQVGDSVSLTGCIVDSKHGFSPQRGAEYQLTLETKSNEKVQLVSGNEFPIPPTMIAKLMQSGEEVSIKGKVVEQLERPPMLPKGIPFKGATFVKPIKFELPNNPNVSLTRHNCNKLQL